MENRGQGELERFRADSRMKKGFVGSILATFSVLKEKGRFQAGFRDTVPIWSRFEQGSQFYPGIWNGNGGKVCTSEPHVPTVVKWQFEPPMLIMIVIGDGKGNPG